MGWEEAYMSIPSRGGGGVGGGGEGDAKAWYCPFSQCTCHVSALSLSCHIL